MHTTYRMQLHMPAHRLPVSPMKSLTAVTRCSHTIQTSDGSPKKTPSIAKHLQGTVVKKGSSSSQHAHQTSRPTQQHDDTQPEQPRSTARSSNTNQNKEVPTKSPSSSEQLKQQDSRDTSKIKQAIQQLPAVDLPDLPLTWREFENAKHPRKSRPSASAASKPTPSKKIRQPPTTGFGVSQNPSALKVFRYATHRESLLEAVVEAGLEDAVELVEDVSLADVVVAVKNTSGGKHQNITQGQRTAENAGLPFVVLGRKLTAENVHNALKPFLKSSAKFGTR